MSQKILEEILTSIRRTPLLSHSAVRLLEIVGDEDYSLADVVRVVECDTVLTANVLKVVNSAALSLREPVTTVSRAVAFLGQRVIVGIALSSSAEQVFDRPLAGYEALRGELWAHSLRTGIASRELAALSIEPVSPDLAFTAGILHDIGKSILSQFLDGLPPEMIEKIDEGQVQNFLQAEEEALGTNHAIVGAALAKHWNLPQPLYAAIRFHHRPFKAPPQYIHLAHITHLADLVAMMGGSGTGADAMRHSLDPNYAQYVRIDRRTLEKLMMTVMIEFAGTLELLFGKEKGEVC